MKKIILLAITTSLLTGCGLAKRALDIYRISLTPIIKEVR